MVLSRFPFYTGLIRDFKDHERTTAIEKLSTGPNLPTCVPAKTRALKAEPATFLRKRSILEKLGSGAVSGDRSAQIRGNIEGSIDATMRLSGISIM